MAILTEPDLPVGAENPRPLTPDFLTSDESRSAMAILLGTIQKAQQVASFELTQFALILGNNRNDDTPQLESAATEASFAQRFLGLFKESFQEFQQSNQFQAVQQGQNVKWTPVLRDANGKIVGGFSPLLVVPTPVANQSLPVLRIEFPHHDWVAQIPPVKQDQHRQALASGHSFTYLDRALTRPQELEVLLKEYPGIQLPSLVSRLTTEHSGYNPTYPAHFHEELSRILEATSPSKEIRQHLFHVVASHFLLKRVSVHPDIAIVSSQRIPEPEFLQVIEPMGFNWPQQRSLLEGGHLVGTNGNSIGYNLLTKGLAVTTQRFAIRQYEPYLEQTLTLMLNETDKKLGQPGLTNEEQRAFQQQYRRAHLPDHSYNPADPIQYKSRLEEVIANALPMRSTTTIDQQLASLQQLTTLGNSPSNLIRITMPAQTPVLLTEGLSQRQTAPESVLNWLTRTTEWVQSIPDQNRQIVNERGLGTTYKGVELTPVQRLALVKGGQIELDGIRDTRRGSLYRASITMDALTGSLQEQKAGASEQLRTDSPGEAIGHQKLTGGGLTAQPTADSKQAENIVRKASHRPAH